MTASQAPAQTDALLRDRVRRLFRELPRALAGDPEAVHQLRVASRRLRVALRLLAPARRGRRLARALRLLRRLGRACGTARDLDVLVSLLADRLAGLERGSAEQRLLLGRLRAARDQSRRQLAEAARDLDIDGLSRRLRRLLRRGAEDASTVVARATAYRRKQAAALLAGFSRLGERYRPEAIHAQRRIVRRLRHAAELEDAILGGQGRAPRTWERLQDLIGVVHDRHLLASWLDRQARTATGRGQSALARAAARERRFFLAESRRLHAALIAARPVDLALRALDASVRAARSRSRQSSAGAPGPTGSRPSRTR